MMYINSLHLQANSELYFIDREFSVKFFEIEEVHKVHFMSHSIKNKYNIQRRV